MTNNQSYLTSVALEDHAWFLCEMFLEKTVFKDIDGMKTGRGRGRQTVSANDLICHQIIVLHLIIAKSFKNKPYAMALILIYS